MKILLLLLTSLTLCGSAQKKYTAEQLKALKPPLLAQQYTLKPKAQISPRLRMNQPEIPKTIPFSPKPKVKALRKSRYSAPRNSVDMHCKRASTPFPEIVIKFEAAQ